MIVCEVCLRVFVVCFCLSCTRLSFGLARVVVLFLCCCACRRSCLACDSRLLPSCSFCSEIRLVSLCVYAFCVGVGSLSCVRDLIGRPRVVAGNGIGAAGVASLSEALKVNATVTSICLLYTSPSPRD